MSVTPPAGNGTTRRIGFDGNAWAITPLAQHIDAIPISAIQSRLTLINGASVFFIVWQVRKIMCFPFVVAYYHLLTRRARILENLHMVIAGCFIATYFVEWLWGYMHEAWIVL